jgi:hypothetical protein
MGPGAAALSFLVGMLILGFIDSVFGQPITAISNLIRSG